MARKLDLVTPDLGAIDSDNPDGKYLNEDAGVPGTPVLAEEKNSIWYFFSRLMDGGSLVWNGIVDNFSLSQYYDALLNIFHGGALVDKWDDTEAALYEAAGYLVQDIEGKHYTSTGLANNLDKDPSDPNNIDYWYPSEGAEALEVQAKKGLPVKSGMHNVTNVQHAQYAQNILEDKIKKGATIYNLYQVIPDGSVLTGDAELEAIFDPGGLNEYKYIDIYAPDVLGTRTFIDIRGRTIGSMTDVGGEFATLGEVKEDQMQGSVVYSGVSVSSNDVSVYSADTSETPGNSTRFCTTTLGAGTGQPISSGPKDDGVNGTPRIGAITHGPLFVSGAQSIKVMIAV